jgi:GntR family phosphonate transport system transcriptional regulator
MKGEPVDVDVLNPNSGVARWRQIAESLVQEIYAHAYKSEERLPSDAALADRFNVNRHTVRRAIAHLQQEGLVRVERGRGTFIVGDVVDYRLGTRTRFTENLKHNKRVASRLVLSVAQIQAPDAAVAGLKLRKGKPCILLQTVGEADGWPLSAGYNYFPLPRCEALLPLAQRAKTRGESVSITELLKQCGVSHYARKQTKISAQLPQGEVAQALKMSPSQPVLCTESIDVDNKDVPVIYAVTLFRADRLQFLVED